MARHPSGLRIVVCLAMSVLLSSLTSLTADADTVFVLSGADFSGPTDNSGGNVTVQISNISGGVRISIANNLVDAGAFPADLYLNNTLAPLTTATASCFSCGAINGNTATFSFGSNAFKADGDGFYDIRIAFSTSVSNRLIPGETVVFTVLASNAGFNDTTFLALSSPAGGHGPFQIAGHIQALPNNQSDWITNPTQTPEPTSLVLLSSGLLAWAGMFWRKRKQ